MGMHSGTDRVRTIVTWVILLLLCACGGDEDRGRVEKEQSGNICWDAKCLDAPLDEENECEEIEEVVTLPVRWEAALDAFAAGKVLPQYLGKTYHETFEKCRREECDRFRSQVSERDYAWYLRAV